MRNTGVSYKILLGMKLLKEAKGRQLLKKLCASQNKTESYKSKDQCLLIFPKVTMHN